MIDVVMSYIHFHCVECHQDVQLATSQDWNVSNACALIRSNGWTRSGRYWTCRECNEMHSEMLVAQMRRTLHAGAK